MTEDYLLPRLLRPARPPDPWSPLRAGPGLSLAALDAMRLEGLVVHVAGPVYLPTEAAAFTACRLEALRLLVPAHAVVGLLAAAWAHGVTVPPDPVDVLVARVSYGARRGLDGVREREMAVAGRHVVTRSGMRLTSLSRTAADVARHAPPATARPVVATLLAAGADVEDVLAQLERERRFPGVVRARDLVREVAEGSARGARRAAARQPVGVEDAVHPPDRVHHVPEVLRVAHLERELGDGHAVP